MNKRLKFTVPIILFVLTFLFTVNNRFDNAVFSLFLMFAWIFFIIGLNRDSENDEDENYDEHLPIKSHITKTPYLVYYGEELNFTDKELTAILIKRFSYFNDLSAIQKTRFIERVQNFIAHKVFKIHDNKGYKEMPVLISAAAIQLTFGLKKYLLPNFEFIHVYPREFMRVQNSICFLEGNVSGHAINLSWKHFLEGYAIPDDGQNVGLHELAHALYYQTFVVEENADKHFRSLYNGFISDGNKAFNTEKTVEGGLYSEYAVKNFQEFWAESVEIFFEKPHQMKKKYPGLYNSLVELLNQDTCSTTPIK